VKKINLLILGLTLSLVMLGTIVLEQQSAAQSTDLGCRNISCKAGASCGGPGTPNGCQITCQNGATINCNPSGGHGEILD
jgi:hypothetical protein